MSSTISLSKVAEVLGLLKQALEDELLGLHVGATVRAGRWGIVGAIVRHSDCLGSAFLRLQSIWARLNSSSTLNLRVDGEHAEVEWDCAFERPSPDVEDLMLAAFVAAAREISGVHFPVTTVYFRRAPPGSLREHEKFYGGALRFRQPIRLLRVPASVLVLRSRVADYRRGELAERAVRHALEARAEHHEGRFLTAARDTLEASVVHGIPTVEGVATRLHLSARALNARLKRSGLTFRALRDGTLCSMAVRMLRVPDASIEDVAENLGFSEKSAFSRAFKKWTGTTPGAFRAAYLESAP